MVSEDKSGGGRLFPHRVLHSRRNGVALKSSVMQEIKEKLPSLGLKDPTFLSKALLIGRRLASHGLLPVCVNIVRLEHSHAHAFPDPPWLLSCYNSRAEGLRQRLYVA